MCLWKICFCPEHLGESFFDQDFSHFIHLEKSPTNRTNNSQKNPISHSFNCTCLPRTHTKVQPIPEKKTSTKEEKILGAAFPPMKLPIQKIAYTCEKRQHLAFAVSGSEKNSSKFYAALCLVSIFDYLYQHDSLKKFIL